MSEKERMHVHIEGRVQGVFFRDSMRQKARELGIAGWARNTPDGKVEAVFEGEHQSIREMLDWCEQGPPQASVQRIKTSPEAPQGESTFEVL